MKESGEFFIGGGEEREREREGGEEREREGWGGEREGGGGSRERGEREMVGEGVTPAYRH